MRRACLLLVLVAPALGQTLRLPSVFGDRMVLQRDVPARVWGWGAPGATVHVALDAQRTETRVRADGSWSLLLSPLEATFEGCALVVTQGEEEVALQDVLVGDVWVCGGQSNMEWKLRSSRDADLELVGAEEAAVRYLRVPHVANPEPQDDFPRQRDGAWRVCVGGEAQDCTAVGYYFAARLRRNVGVPIGLIDISWGGTMAQHWVSKETLVKFPEMTSHLEDFAAKREAWSEGGGAAGAVERHAAAVAAWEKTDRSKGKPRAQADPAEGRQPAGMWNGMVLPIAPTTVRGVLFYQGENNSFGESWKPFPSTFPAVVADWRRAFDTPELPFGLVQIAGWSNRRAMTYDMNHHTNVVREVQLDTWRATPGTGLVVTYDTNSNGSIHPGHKRPVGERAARWALAEVYGVDLEWRGPVFAGAVVEEGRLVVSFEEGTARGLRLDRDTSNGFYVAGEDQVFHHAQARVVSENRLRVWSDAVPEPVAVRYAWSNLPCGGLMNARELPAYPFRSDDWPLTPHQSTGSYER